ncbi:DUF192 domain-containing protein [Sulfitobacter sp. F26169L]|uniref:DUF192 domain-containing protein n=1 Tax=Sulfitobacter sp. F26169L TaxID=2996015 RepID=UPI002260B74D|nr:DUF192 domain-containing protein [Sulfitobacter sp. F26169L]MCX7566162.1 DUF192 domain-containing protein [Sulfitobacter sp. F26169L]
MGSSGFNRRGFLTGIAAGAAIFASGVQAKAPYDPCGRDNVMITGGFGTAMFRVDVVADEQSRARGLMHVPKMPMSYGMLFYYPEPQLMSFWMRNTLIELDMLFIDAAGVIRHIHERAKPLDETPISGGDDLLSGVLEINGGLARRIGIKAGDVVYHPHFATTIDTAHCDVEK